MLTKADVLRRDAVALAIGAVALMLWTMVGMVLYF